MNKNLLIVDAINGSIETKKKIIENQEILETIEKISEVMITALTSGRKVLFCGNGGSAADAQHLAAELSGKFYIDREPLFAEALHCNTSYLTAVANDYSFDNVFERIVKGMGREGDVLVGISTSGNSKNVVKAMEVANQKGMATVGFTGGTGGKMKEVCKCTINVPSSDTPRIQESHILIAHIICEIVEKKIFGNKT